MLHHLEDGAGPPTLERQPDPEPGQRDAVHRPGGAQVEGSQRALERPELREATPDLPECPAVIADTGQSTGADIMGEQAEREWVTRVHPR